MEGVFRVLGGQIFEGGEISEVSIIGGRTSTRDIFDAEGYKIKGSHVGSLSAMKEEKDRRNFSVGTVSEGTKVDGVARRTSSLSRGVTIGIRSGHFSFIIVIKVTYDGTYSMWGRGRLIGNDTSYGEARKASMVVDEYAKLF